jgi:LytR cell envelope-related transcriptional attenuator
MELIERIGAFLGLAAFLGLGVLALLYFQQGREVRRLRDWAGRAPERAAAAVAEAETALGAEEAEGGEPKGPTIGERVGARWRALTERLPRGIGEHVPAPRYMALIALGIVLIGVGVATGGFGLVGDDEPAKKKGEGKLKPQEIEVAVLNGTAAAEGEPGVPGLAAEVGDEVKGFGYKVGPVSDAGTPFVESVVMYESGSEAPAERVAQDIAKQLGRTPVQKMSGEVKDLADGAAVAIVIGQDDAGV